jgi:hypothetical protein
MKNSKTQKSIKNSKAFSISNFPRVEKEVRGERKRGSERRERMSGKEADDLKISLSTPQDEAVMFFSRYFSYQKSTFENPRTFSRRFVKPCFTFFFYRIEFKKG